jgi:hypothetical protein
VGVSSYDSLQTKFQRRWHNGLAFLLAYTLSEAKTNAGDSLANGLVGDLRGPDLIGRSIDEDIRLAPFHTKHSLVFSGNYDLPGKGILLGGWRANWVMMLYSGQAQTVRCAVQTNATQCWANVVGDPYEGAGTVENYYNAAAFATPTPVATIGQPDFSPLGGPGTQVTGPGLKQLDFGLAKSFNVGAQRRVEFRIETFNLTNTPAFELPPNSTMDYRDARNFAAINRMRNTPRQMQLGLKFYW